MNISEALARMRLVFPWQSICVLTDIPQPTHWSRDQTLQCEQTEEEAGNACYLLTRAASMLIFTSFEVRAPVQNATFNFKFNTWNRGATHNEHSTDEGHRPSPITGIYCMYSCAINSRFKKIYVYKCMHIYRHRGNSLS